MHQLSPELLEQLNNCKNLPTLPKAALRIVQVAQDPEIDMGMVADAVSADPAIAAKVMRIANSALYARRRKSTNLRQALMTLGLNATLTLALSFTLITKLRKDPIKGFDFAQYWKRSILAGSWSRLLTNEVEANGAEEVFLIALLQDIGMLAIDRVAPEVYEGISPFEMPHSKVEAHEVSCIGANHCDVGAWLMEDWNMPAMIVRSIGATHDYTGASTDEDIRAVSQIAALSGLLADSCMQPGSAKALAAIGKVVTENLNISAEALAGMYDMLLEQIPEAESVFEVDLMTQDEIESITETARETLLIRNLSVFSQAAELVERAESLHNENQELKVANRSDELTGVHNRRHFEDALAEEYEFATRHSSALSLIFVDIDYFKQANDIHGHLAGDRVLKHISRHLQDTVRTTDIVARYGGDEFVIILPGTNAEQTDIVSGRIVSGARELEVRSESGDLIKVTLSLGTATQDAAHDFKSAAGLIRAADTALYESKRKGRDCHTAYTETKVA